MMDYRGNNDDRRLDALFQAYRGACGAPEASANFMPNLWQKIEARQRLTFRFGRLARGFATAAVALSMLMGVYLAVPGTQPGFYTQSYIEALADHQSDATELMDVSVDQIQDDEAI